MWVPLVGDADIPQGDLTCGAVGDLLPPVEVSNGSRAGEEQGRAQAAARIALMVE